MTAHTPTLFTLKQLLDTAEPRGFAVGAFSPRYTPMIRAILQAGERLRSPVIIQIAQAELHWYALTIEEFAHEFWRQIEAVRPTVPIGLHLDHTSDFDLIQKAIAHGFSSVMIDASTLPLEQNIAETRRVVDFAHPQGVSVEAELGRIGSADQIETTVDEEQYTDPQEAAEFCRQTGVDALAVSVGTAHGVYQVRQPKIDRDRLKAIRALTPVHLVLHGGSGTPAEMIGPAIRLPDGGISKINFATDLELALLKALDLPNRTTDAVLRRMPWVFLERGLQAVQHIVEDKITHFVSSQAHADDYAPL